ncbi:hypothetical protein IE4872_PD01070 (plasmid) [Rhizobium gallicum]|uniref:Uncharacterized protein n=1 Tax=Rhizobium gallicum TaxID=56730 RepID=A0A1L5NUL3_9HYPH|nr:hypothetical protein IE4872_PD01070 [Rhizobium gallicum]
MCHSCRSPEVILDAAEREVSHDGVLPLGNKLLGDSYNSRFNIADHPLLCKYKPISQI